MTGLDVDYTVLIPLFAGLLITVFQKKVFGLPVNLAIVYFLWHMMFCILYYLFSLGIDSDAQQYYDFSFRIVEEFSLGTVSIYYLTSLFSVDLGMGYFSTFLTFGVIGFVGIVAFAAALRDISMGLPRRFQVLAVLLPMLPGMNFWTSMIGKDALTLLATGLCCWASVAPNRRYAALILAVLLYFVARPYIGALVLATLATTAVLFARIPFSRRAMIAMMSAPLGIYAASIALELVGLNSVQSAVDLGDYVASRQITNLEGGSSINIADMSPPVRMFTYMFRPLFFDASGAAMLVASVENAILLTFFLYAALLFVRHSSNLSKFSTWFVIICAVALWIMLGNTTANLGLASRQKWMILPFLLLLTFIYAMPKRGLVRRPPAAEAGRTRTFPATRGIAIEPADRRPVGSIG